MIKPFAYILIFVLASGFFKLNAQTPSAPQLTRILFILDGSQSMYGRWENEQKIQVARRLLSELLDSLKNIQNLELALRAYGHQNVVATGNRNCQDTKLEIPFGKGNSKAIKDKLGTITPKGTTLIAYSLQEAANDFPACPDCRNIIILITDGIEECDGDPCAVSMALQEKGVALKPFVIGMGLDDITRNQFKCVGNYYDASDSKTFKHVLGIVISQALNNTTAQVNLLDAGSEPTETDVPMTFYDSHSGAIRYNFVHTINHRGVPDTIPLNPLGKYNLTVHTMPPVHVKDIELIPGKHNIIAAETPQGELLLKVHTSNEYKQLQAIVRQSGKTETLNVQDFERKKKYLTGKYDLEILSTPRMSIKDVLISQSHVTTVEIPQPGLVTLLLLSRGYGSILLEENNTLKWVCDISENITRESIVLQPGRYRVIFRSINSKNVIYSQEKSFKIESGASTQIKL